MDTIVAIWTDYGDQIVRTALEIIALITLTKWGAAHRQALQIVAAAIERAANLKPLAGGTLKRNIEIEERKAGPDASAALQSAVARAEVAVLGATDKPRPGIAREVIETAIRLLGRPVVAWILIPLGVAAAAAGLAACVTTVAPDGTRTVQADHEAIAVLTPLLLDALDRVEMYQARRDQAEAEQDAAEVERLERLIAYWERIAAVRAAALEAAGGTVPTEGSGDG